MIASTEISSLTSCICCYYVLMYILGINNGSAVECWYNHYCQFTGSWTVPVHSLVSDLLSFNILKGRWRRFQK